MAIPLQRVSATRSWSTHSTPWLLVLFLGIALAFLAGSTRLRPWPTYAVDLRQPLPDVPFQMAGVHALETAGGQAYRWTTDYPFVQVRQAYHLAPLFRATLTIKAERPDGPQPVTFLLNERPLATIQPTTALRTYTFLLPHQPDSDGSLRFAASTKPLLTPGDARRLGFITTRWTLDPQFAVAALGPLTPDEIVVVGCTGIALAGLLALRVGWRMAIPLAAITAIAVLALRGLYRPAPIRFTHLALLTFGGVAAIPWLTRRSGIAASLALLMTTATFAGSIWPSWITDDALISFRYAQNLVDGNGLVYNVGERVEGYTNFLWTMLAAAALALGGDPVVLSYYAGVLIALCVIAAVFVQTRTFLGEGWACAAAVLLGTSHSLLLYTARGSGLETGLFALLLVVSSHLFLTDRLSRAGAIFALAALTRPEGVLPLGLAALFRLIEQRRLERGTLRMVGTFALIATPFFAWRFAYYGDLLPNTFYAKTGGGAAQALRGLVYAGRFALFLGAPLLVVLLPLALRSLWQKGQTRTRRRWLLYSLTLVGMFTLYIVAVGGDHFPGYRFFTPVLPFLVMLLAAGAQQLTNVARQHLGRGAPVLAAVLLVALASFNLSRSRAFDPVILGDDESVWLWRELGWWIEDHAAPGESVAALGAGAIPYYSRHPTVDLLGLNDKYIARLSVETMGTGTAGHEKRAPDYVLHTRKPAYIPGIWVDYFGGEQALKATGLYQEQEIVTRHGRRLVLWKRVQ